MAYTNGDGISHARRTCRRLHNTGRRIRRVDGDGLTPCEHCTDDAHTEDTSDSDAALIEDGLCPWCDDYEGEYVGSHASSAHPEKWAAYND